MKKRKVQESYDEEVVEVELNDEITSSKNKVYFHCEVSRKNILKLCMELEKAVKYVREYMDDDSRIHLYLHTEGGDLYAGLSGMNHIKNCKVPVVTHVDGFVASAGTYMLLAGEKRVMSKYSQVLIHQLRSGVIGTYNEILEESANCTKIMNMGVRFYNEYCKIPKKVLDNLLKKEVYLDPEECLKYKIIDEIC